MKIHFKVKLLQLVAGAAALFISQAASLAAPSAELRVDSKWDGGFTGTVTIKNAGSVPINGWTLNFDLNRNIAGSWSAVQKSKSGSTYTFANESWNGKIPVGGSVTFGMQVDGAARDAVFSNAKLNGTAIASTTVGNTGGSNPDGGGTATTDIVFQEDASGELLQFVLAAGTTNYQFKNTGTYSAVSNNPAVATVSVAAGKLVVTAKKAGRASIRITESTSQKKRVIGVRVNNPDGTAPGLPNYLAIGSVSEDATPDLEFWSDFGTATKNKRADIRYIYLNGGASNSIGDGWNWRVLNNGERATRFVEESLRLGMIPFFVWYNIPDSGESYYTDKQHIESATYMQGYFADLKHALEITREAAGGEIVGWVLEPDSLGYFAQNDPGTPDTIVARTDAAYTSGVLKAGVDPAFPNTLKGLVQAINYTIRKYQPTAYFGWQFNLWASPAGGFTNAGITGKGLARLTDTQGLAKGRNAIYREGKAVADYYVSAGILSSDADFISIDKYGLDAGFENKNDDPSQSTWFWNAEHWTNYLVFVNALHDVTGLPVTLWQIPVGRINSSTAISPYTSQRFPSLPNTTRKYEDSAATYFFGDTFSTTAARAAYFGATDGGVSKVTANGNTLTWGEHLSLARDAGVNIALFGPGVGESTDNVGADEDYYWISRVQQYYTNPVTLVANPVGITLPEDPAGNPGGENPGGENPGGENPGGGTATGSIAATLTVVSDWGSGYTANVNLKNTGTAPVTGWTVSFDLDDPITTFWSAKGGTRSGSKVTFTNESWNGVIAPGQTVTFGIQTSSSADKVASNFSVNGQGTGTGGGTGGNTGGDNGGGTGGNTGGETGGGDNGGGTTTPVLPADRVVVGYWQNWNDGNSPYISLRNVDSRYSQVNVSFAESAAGSGTMNFSPLEESKVQFKQDVRTLQQRGTAVVISIGGANSPLELDTATKKAQFITSMKAIIDEYGFNGLDIDLEGHSVILQAGDTDFKNPKTPKIINLISAIRELTDYYGPNFILTAAPETQYITGGYGTYGGAFGGYLPVIHALRDKLTFVHIQYYNTGSQYAYTGVNDPNKDLILSQSTKDFIVAQTEMLIEGFPVGRNASNVFPGLGADKVAIGLPATPSAAPAGGYLAPAEVKKALDYLTTGVSGYANTYKLRRAGGHPGLRGMMTWSVNWDKTTNGGTASNEFVANYSDYFSKLPVNP